MRLIHRALSGIVLWSITLALVGAAVWHLQSALSSSNDKKKRIARERSYVVDVAKLTKSSVSPSIEAYGQIQAWNTLEIRAPAAGPITEISENFREGKSVSAGELLFRIDPEISQRRVTDARAALEQAETERGEAAATQTHIESDIQAAKSEVDVRRSDLRRKKTLFEKKLTTSTIYDESALALTAAEQNVAAKQRELLALKGRISKAEAGVERARITLSDAERLLKDTAYRAPFAGRLSEVTLTLGRRVSENEKLGVLIDPEELEVSFPVRNSEFGRLLNPNDKQKVAPLPVTVTLDLSGKTMSATALLDRPAATASSVAGRTVYARITGGDVGALRPGDFVEVAVKEAQIADVAIIPASAATLDGRFFLIGKNNRLVEHKADIVRRQSETLLVKNVPFGEAFLVRRLPYLSRGTRVQAKEGMHKGDDGLPVANASDADPAEDSISTKRRAELIAFVQNRKDIPERRRDQLVHELQKPDPGRQLIERVERRMAEAEQRS